MQIFDVISLSSWTLRIFDFIVAYQTITWASDDLTSVMYNDIRLRAISQVIPNHQSLKLLRKLLTQNYTQIIQWSIS